MSTAVDVVRASEGDLDRGITFVLRIGAGVSDGGGGDKHLLGGKGANLAEMASIGLPVPPGFTVSTAMCAHYHQ